MCLFLRAFPAVYVVPRTFLEKVGIWKVEIAARNRGLLAFPQDSKSLR